MLRGVLFSHVCSFGEEWILPPIHKIGGLVAPTELILSVSRGKSLIKIRLHSGNWMIFFIYIAAVRWIPINVPQTDFWISLKRQIFQTKRKVSEQYKLYFCPMVCFCLKKTFRIIIKTLKHCLILLFIRLDLYLTFHLWKRKGGGRGRREGKRKEWGEEDTTVCQPLLGTPSLSPILLFSMSSPDSAVLPYQYRTQHLPECHKPCFNSAPGREWPREKVIKWSSSQPVLVPEIKGLSSDSILETFVWNPIATLHKALPSAGCFPGMLAFYCSFAGDTFEVNEKVFLPQPEHPVPMGELDN